MTWTIRYIEKGDEHTLTVSGTPKDAETAISVIEAKHGKIVSIVNSNGNAYYPIAKKEA